MADWKPRKLSFTLDSAEEAEHFLRGLVVAQSNNSSELFPQLIEGVNGVLEGYRAAKVLEEVTARDEALKGL